MLHVENGLGCLYGRMGFEFRFLGLGLAVVQDFAVLVSGLRRFCLF